MLLQAASGSPRRTILNLDPHLASPQALLLTHQYSHLSDQQESRCRYRRRKSQHTAHSYLCSHFADYSSRQTSTSSLCSRQRTRGCSSVARRVRVCRCFRPSGIGARRVELHFHVQAGPAWRCAEVSTCKRGRRGGAPKSADIHFEYVEPKANVAVLPSRSDFDFLRRPRPSGLAARRVPFVFHS